MRLVAQPLNPEPLSFLPCPVFLILSLLVARKGDFFFHGAKGAAETGAEHERGLG